MNHLKQRLVANFAGQAWSALLGIALIPVYVHFLGIEAYGLIGFYSTFQLLFQAFDFGLSPTMNREMARYSVNPENAQQARDLARTLEIPYWSLGVLIGIVVGAAAPFIASYWLKATVLSTPVVQQVVVSMGLLFILQWPLSFYVGGLIGLQRQVLLNTVLIVVATVRAVGSVLVLWLIEPTITAFFAWQIIMSALHVILITALFWHCLPASRQRPHFNLNLLRGIGRFAAGMTGIMLTALILTQLDKLLLSNLLSLEMFGYYMLASLVASGLMVIIDPVFNTVFPRFSVLVVGENVQALKQLYHGGTQVMAVLALPAAGLIAFYANEVLLLWTRSATTAHYVAPIASVLVVGTALNGLMFLPYALQLAYGWTSLGLRINIFLIITLVPAIFVMVNWYGAIGAAMVWPILNGIYMLIGVPLTHRRVLKGEALRWFSQDVILALISVVAINWFALQLLDGFKLKLPSVLFLIGIWVVATLCAALAASQVRGWLFTFASKKWMTYRLEHRIGTD